MWQKHGVWEEQMLHTRGRGAKGKGGESSKCFEDFVQFMMKQGSLEGAGPVEGRSTAGDFLERQPRRDAIGWEH